MDCSNTVHFFYKKAKKAIDKKGNLWYNKNRNEKKRRKRYV